jgi:hypothetical protein
MGRSLLWHSIFVNSDGVGHGGPISTISHTEERKLPPLIAWFLLPGLGQHLARAGG